MGDESTLFQGGDDRRLARDQSLRGRRPPAQVPGYRFERFLGAGAYGEVWLAIDANTQRRVAIKFYSHRGGLDWSLLTREVEKLSFMFADRRVVQLLEVGWHSDPPYYVMEFLEQGSLEDRLNSSPIPPAEAVELWREIALGLVHAHAKGLLHCDLKPANILFGADGKPRLADFGQSRLSHEQIPALGTLFYMAPEQADLKASPHARWDVYALGAVAYRMLVGEPPHRHNDTVAELEQQTDLEQRLERYRRAISRGPRPREHRRVRGVDTALADIIDRCLEPNAERRFTNVQSVLEALERRRARRARRPLLVLGAVVPAVLLAVMALFAWNSFQRAVADSRAAVLGRVAQSNRFAAEFVAEAVTRKIEKRWELLQSVAHDPELARLLEAAQSSPGMDDPARLELQRFLERRHQQLDEERQIWLLNNGLGIQLVRIPPDVASIGRNFSFRDYFHGLGRDLSPESPAQPPIQEPHLSVAFQGKASRQQLVAFSVPVRAPGDEANPGAILGVLSMTVPLGGFAELSTSSSADHKQRAVLVDLRPDENNLPGAVIEHPAYNSAALSFDKLEGGRVHLLASDLPRLEAAGQLAFEVTQLSQQLQHARRSLVGAPAESIGQLEQSLAVKNRELAAVDFLVNHHDPFSQHSDDAWLVAVRPVLTGDSRETLRRTGWMVMVEEPYRAATEPIRRLAEQLLARGALALAVVIALVIGVWGFVILLVSDSGRGSWSAAVQRRLGVGTPSSGSGSLGQSQGSGASHRTPAAHSPAGAGASAGASAAEAIEP